MRVYPMRFKTDRLAAENLLSGRKKMTLRTKYNIPLILSEPKNVLYMCKCQILYSLTQLAWKFIVWENKQI